MIMKAENKFPRVKVVKSFLGIDENTILYFDVHSSKYINITEEEDIGEGYYYSGSALALDPWLIKDNPEYFEVAEVRKPASKKLKVVRDDTNVATDDYDEAVDKYIKAENKSEQVEASDKEMIDETNILTRANVDPPETAYKAETGVLTFICGSCHNCTSISRMSYGLFFPVSEHTELTLKCETCGIETRVFFEMDDKNDES